MKIAGQKNPGAWFRFNSWLFKGNGGSPQPPSVITALHSKLVGSDFIDAAFNALDALANEAGQGGIINSAEEWVDSMLSDGIPLQIWMGRLSWTSYVRTGSPGSYEYTPNAQSEIHYFANDLRKICAHFKASIREVSDVFNVGGLGENNPGGKPNANQSS